VDTIEELNAIFQRVFQDDALKVSRNTTAKDVDGWDSVRHVSLMVAVEQTFKLKFTSREVASLKDVGELVDLIARKKKP
jgi:acyl carrier protein